MATDDDVWFGDEESEELPVLTAPAGSTPPLPATGSRHRLTPSRGVPMSAVQDARRHVLSEATGQATTEPDEWRMDMELGNRDRAAGSLSSGGRRKSSGFGLA